MFDPNGSGVGSLTVQIYDVPADAVVSATVGGPPVTVTTTVPGQVGRVTFSGTAGQRISWLFTSGTVTSTITVLKPDGSTLRNGQTVSSSASFPAIALPVDGMYTVVFDPQGSGIGSISVQVVLN